MCDLVKICRQIKVKAIKIIQVHSKRIAGLQKSISIYFWICFRNEINVETFIAKGVGV